jgi:hypothetical protein
MLGLPKKSATVGEVWRKLTLDVEHHYPKEMEPWKNTIGTLLSDGSLAERILKVTNNEYERNNLKLVYRELCENLEDNKQFETCLTVN